MRFPLRDCFAFTAYAAVFFAILGAGGWQRLVVATCVLALLLLWHFDRYLTDTQRVVAVPIVFWWLCWGVMPTVH